MGIDIDNLFSAQVFLIVLRETLESAIIISVLLAFLHQNFSQRKREPKTIDNIQGQQTQEGNSAFLSSEPTRSDPELTASYPELHNYLRLQVWFGGFFGLAACLLIGALILLIFYWLGNDLWSITEHYWEGSFSILASIIISVMGVKILRVNKMHDKWKRKLSEIMSRSDTFNKAMRHNSQTEEVSQANDVNARSRFSRFSDKYSMFILPFVTTLREGMEAVVFIGGIGINENTSIRAIAISAIAAMSLGIFIGFLLYRSGNSLSLQWFLVSSSCFLYMVAAGLLSKGVWSFELQRFIDLAGGLDVSETGHGPGSYDIKQSVWHVNCCNGEMQEDGAFWMMATAIVGWTNSATYGSVISYIFYWSVIILVFRSLTYEEKHGILPLIPKKWQQKRINKRAWSYQPLSPPEIDALRTSMDSLNSQTPLNV